MHLWWILEAFSENKRRFMQQVHSRSLWQNVLWGTLAHLPEEICQCRPNSCMQSHNLYSSLCIITCASKPEFSARILGTPNNASAKDSTPSLARPCACFLTCSRKCLAAATYRHMVTCSAAMQSCAVLQLLCK